MRQWLKWTLAIVVLLILHEVVFDQGRIAAPFYVVAGWIFYVIEVLPKVRVGWDTLISTIICILVFAVGFHLFCRWLYRERNQGNWPIRWTAIIVAIVMLLFTAGIGATGAAHQVVFLATQEEPMFTDRRRPETEFIRCGSNMRQIGQALLLFAREHQGRFPDSLDELVHPDALEPEALFCNAVWSKNRRDAKTAAPFDSDYIYLGRGLREPIPADRVVLLEPLSNHDGEGANVLLANGQVQRLPPAKLGQILSTLSTPP